MASPTDAYRKQQGLAPITQSYDPEVVSWIEKAAKQTGADPNALLATAIQESGARRGAVGDAGTSFGPFQHHKGGALGTHPAAWANTYAATFERAQQFAKGQVHHGKGAAAIQRPADRQLYQRGVDSHMEQARRIIARDLTTAAHDAVKEPEKKTAAPTPDDIGKEIPGNDLLSALMLNPVQSALDSNAKIAGVAAPVLPAGSVSSATPAPTALSRKPKATKPVLPKLGGRVVPGKPKIIGTPHSGTHNLGNWESDDAVDIALSKGTPIRAPFSGIIGSRIGSLDSKNPRFAGLRVHLKGGGDELYFAHLSRLTVKAGQRVKAGQIIGYSGVANGVAHLHLGSKNGNPGKYA